MSHSSERTAVIAPVSSVAEAAAAMEAGAQFVDPGTDEALISALRRGRFPMLDTQAVQVEASEAGGGVIGGVTPGLTPDLAAGATAGLAGNLAAGLVGGLVGGRPAFVDVDGWGTPAAVGAVAAVCAWQGVRMIRTRHVTEVRRCLDMTESILGTRPPARAVRGLA